MRDAAGSGKGKQSQVRKIDLASSEELFSPILARFISGRAADEAFMTFADNSTSRTVRIDYAKEHEPG